MNKFNGVVTKYLDNCMNWFRIICKLVEEAMAYLTLALPSNKSYVLAITLKLHDFRT